MSATHVLPLFFNASRLRVLIVGGGGVAVRRASMLLDAGASVRVVAPSLSPDLPEACSVDERPFHPIDVVGFTLVIAATDAWDVNDAVGAACDLHGVLCCRADDASAGDFTFPVAVHEGPMTAAVTAGSPALTNRLADEVQRVLAPHAAHATAVAALRDTVIGATQDPQQRREALADAASEEAAEVVRQDNVDGLRLWLANRHPWLAGDLLEKLG